MVALHTQEPFAEFANGLFEECFFATLCVLGEEGRNSGMDLGSVILSIIRS